MGERLAKAERTFQQTSNVPEGIHLLSHEDMKIKATVRCHMRPLE